MATRRGKFRRDGRECGNTFPNPAAAQLVSKGRVTRAELKRLGKALYGYGWQTRLAEALDVEGSTVRRWVSGAVPIPGPAAAAIKCFAREKQIIERKK